MRSNFPEGEGGISNIEHPILNDEVEIAPERLGASVDCRGAGSLALLFEVALVVFLGFVELGGGDDLSDDWPFEEARLLELLHRGFGKGLLVG